MSHRKQIRIAIASGQPIFRRGLAALVMSLHDVQLVGEAVDQAETIQLCELVEPEILLLDLERAVEDGKDLIHLIHRRWPRIKIISFRSFPDESLAQENLEPGATYFLSRDIAEEAFVEAVLQIGLDTFSATQDASPDMLQQDNLQHLAHELQNAHSDRVGLATLLTHYLPVIFPDAQINVRIFPGQDLVAYPARASSPLVETALRWLRTAPAPCYFLPGDKYPWGNKQAPGGAFLVAPILKETHVVGGICIQLPKVEQDIPALMPVLQTLANQVSTAMDLNQSLAKHQTGEVLTRELVMAGKIQADILPEKAPSIPGYDVSAFLESARETSGDFYDFIPLTDRSWGIVIADVADKGMGAALFMALSNTLIRSYANRYPSLPGLTMSVVNERILSDTRGSMFVTAFYAVLEPHIGRLRYVNAGHSPPYLISTQKGKPVDRLRATGMALGVMEKAHWQQKVTKMAVGDVLLLYTDGVTEAQNSQGDYFGDQRLFEVARAHSGKPAREILEAVMLRLNNFVGEMPRQDDVALVVVCRKE